MSEASEYEELKKNASAVYCEVTKGLLCAPHYSAEHVISVYKSVHVDLVDKSTVCDDMLQLVGDNPELRQHILEYFGETEQFYVNMGEVQTSPILFCKNLKKFYKNALLFYKYVV